MSKKLLKRKMSRRRNTFRRKGSLKKNIRRKTKLSRNKVSKKRNILRKKRTLKKKIKGGAPKPSRRAQPRGQAHPPPGTPPKSKYMNTGVIYVALNPPSYVNSGQRDVIVVNLTGNDIKIFQIKTKKPHQQIIYTDTDIHITKEDSVSLILNNYQSLMIKINGISQEIEMESDTINYPGNLMAYVYNGDDYKVPSEIKAHDVYSISKTSSDSEWKMEVVNKIDAARHGRRDDTKFIVQWFDEKKYQWSYRAEDTAKGWGGWSFFGDRGAWESAKHWRAVKSLQGKNYNILANWSTEEDSSNVTIEKQQERYFDGNSQMGLSGNINYNRLSVDCGRSNDSVDYWDISVRAEWNHHPQRIDYSYKTLYTIAFSNHKDQNEPSKKNKAYIVSMTWTTLCTLYDDLLNLNRYNDLTEDQDINRENVMKKCIAIMDQVCVFPTQISTDIFNQPHTRKRSGLPINSFPRKINTRYAQELIYRRKILNSDASEVGMLEIKAVNNIGDNVKYSVNFYNNKDIEEYRYRPDMVYLSGREWDYCSKELKIEGDLYDEEWIYNIFRRCFTLDRVFFDSSSLRFNPPIERLTPTGISGDLRIEENAGQSTNHLIVNNQSSMNIILEYLREDTKLWHGRPGFITEGESYIEDLGEFFHNKHYKQYIQWRVSSQTTSDDPTPKLHTFNLVKRGDTNTKLLYIVDIYDNFNLYKGNISKSNETRTRGLGLSVRNQTDKNIDVYYLWEGNWGGGNTISPQGDINVVTNLNVGWCVKIEGVIVFEWKMEDKDHKYNVTITQSGHTPTRKKTGQGTSKQVQATRNPPTKQTQPSPSLSSVSPDTSAQVSTPQPALKDSTGQSSQRRSTKGESSTSHPRLTDTENIRFKDLKRTTSSKKTPTLYGSLLCGSELLNLWLKKSLNNETIKYVTGVYELGGILSSSRGYYIIKLPKFETFSIHYTSFIEIVKNTNKFSDFNFPEAPNYTGAARLYDECKKRIKFIDGFFNQLVEWLRGKKEYTSVIVKIIPGITEER